MFERLNRLYIENKITKAGVRNAVVKGWITAAEYAVITGEEY